MLTFVLVACASFVVAAAGVPIARRIALSRGLLDMPNDRSSHRIPTPRTGGIGLIAGIVAGVSAALLAGGGAPDLHAWLFLGALLAGAAVGFLDDLFSLPTALRMPLYLAAAAALALSGASVREIGLPGLPAIGLGHLGGLAFSALFIAWYTNLFNFMDGIDGIAGATAAVTLDALAVVFLAHGEPLWGLLALAAAAASAGFLLHNYPPAAVFMGDGGAIFLGLAAGALSLTAVALGHLSLPAAVLLMLPFVFDATFTLCLRIGRRERFWAAHRSHVYQRLGDLGLDHRSVTICYFVAAVVFAALGLIFDELSRTARTVSWWGSLGLLLGISIWVVRKRPRRPLQPGGFEVTDPV